MVTAKSASLGPKQPIQCAFQGVPDANASKIDRAAMRTPRQKGKVMEPHFEHSLPREYGHPGMQTCDPSDGLARAWL